MDEGFRRSRKAGRSFLNALNATNPFEVLISQHKVYDKFVHALFDEPPDCDSQGGEWRFFRMALECHGESYPAEEVRCIITQAGCLEHIVCRIAQGK